MKQSIVLEKEINLIKNKLIKEWTINTLENVPMYFWVAQASSSGKYHPECTIKKGGLITHVKRAVYIANHLCEGWGIFEYERDIVLSATILHDIAKTPNPHVAHLYGMITTDEDFINHPLNAEKYFDESSDLYKEPDMNTIRLINECVKYHMGRWTPDSIKKDMSEYSLVELAVYTSDYLSSRKDLTTPKDNE